MSAAETKRLALRGDLLDFTAAPGWADTGLRGVRWREDHWLLIEGGRIVGAQPGSQAPDASWTRQDHRGRLIMAGGLGMELRSRCRATAHCGAACRGR